MKKRPNVEPTQPSLFALDKPDDAVAPVMPQEIVRPFDIPGTQILLGTSAFTANGWQGSFYPPGMNSRDFLSYYATQFSTVEVDSTFYGCPSANTVNNWADRTPEDFIFSVKVPQFITHEKVLVDYVPDFEEFVKTMDILGPKLGPIIFQFPSFDRWKFHSTPKPSRRWRLLKYCFRASQKNRNCAKSRLTPKPSMSSTGPSFSDLATSSYDLVVPISASRD